jgi:hypothetical protein
VGGVVVCVVKAYEGSERRNSKRKERLKEKKDQGFKH